jgi:microcin C transport system substrate-binding protein
MSHPRLLPLLPAAAAAGLLLTCGCAKKQAAVARDIYPVAAAYYRAHPNFFLFKTPADLPKNLVWQDGHDVPEFADPNAQRGGTLHYFIDDFPRTLRFVGPDDNGSFRAFILDDVAVTLLQRQPNTGQYFPGLARQWAYDPDGRTMYFKLDPDARFSDGVPVTADDFLFAFYFYRSKWIVEPWYNNYYSTNFSRIIKYDDHTIAITWKEAKPDLTYKLGSVNPIPEHFYKDFGPDFVQRYQWTIEPTTGPYTVLPQDIHKGSSIDLTHVKNWWAEDKKFYRHRYNFDRVHLEVIRDPAKAFEAFKRGDLDSFGLFGSGFTLPEYWYQKMPNSDPLVQHGYIDKVTFYNEIPRPTYGLYLNEDMPLLNNRDIRLGINYATNFDLVDRTYFHGDYQRMQTSADGYAEVPFPHIHARPFSVPKALEYFAKAGFTKRGPDGILVNAQGQRLSFTITTGYANLRDVLTILKQEAAKAGLEYNIEVLDNTTAWKKTEEKQHQIAFAAFAVSVEEYPRYWEMFDSVNAHKPQTNNLTDTAIPAMDKLIDEYDKATTMDQVRSLATQLETMVHDDAAFVPGFEIPFYRVGYWRWIRWPKDFNVRFSQYAGQYGLEWMDPAMKKETLAARSAGRTFPPTVAVYDQWKRKDD